MALTLNHDYEINSFKTLQSTQNMKLHNTNYPHSFDFITIHLFVDIWRNSSYRRQIRYNYYLLTSAYKILFTS